MKCYYCKKESYGVCKCCGCGLCNDCMIDLDLGISCKNHVGEVKTMNKVISSNLSQYKKLKMYYYMIPIIYTVFGIFMAFDIYRKEGASLNNPYFLFSIFVIAFGLALFGYSSSIDGDRYEK